MSTQASSDGTPAPGADAGSVARDDVSLAVLRRTEAAYGRFVPRRFLELLGRESVLDIRLGDHVERPMSILFSDLRNFTALSETMTPRQTFNFVNSYLSVLESVIEGGGGIIDKYMGDAVMVLFPDGADTAVGTAIAMRHRLREYNEGRRRAGYQPVQAGIGINTGIVMLGVIGGPGRLEGTVIGDAVNVAARVESLTKTYGTPLVISDRTLFALEDDERFDIRFLDRVRLHGRSQPQSMYEVYDADDAPLRQAKRRTAPCFEKALAHYHLHMPATARGLLDLCLAEGPDDMAARVYRERCEALPREASRATAVDIDAELKWSADMVVGIEAIDREHMTILERINDLRVRMERAPHAFPRAELDALQSTAIDHFHAEESLMTALGYPLAEQHLAAHRKFLRNLDRLEAALESGTLAPPESYFRLLLLLVDMFADHTIGTDRHLWAFAREAGYR